VEGVRYLPAFALAAAVTFGLFWVMQALIGIEGELDESGAGHVVDFVRLKKESETETKKRKLPDKKPPEEEPPPPELNLAKNSRPDQAMGNVIPIFDSGVDISGGPSLGGLGAADQDIVPLVRVNPEYPVRAAQRGIEGWVEISFSISATGTVKNAKVVGYEPSSVFNRSALRAIRKWKYNPKVEDGKAVERPGVVVRLSFRLEK
jgi:protein TonB